MTFGLAEFFLFAGLLSAVKGDPRLLSSSEPVVGLVDEDVILPCSVQPAESVAEKTVEWTRSDLNLRFIHTFREGRELYDQQNPYFQQRTNLFLNELKNGNMSLKLSRLKPTDKGNYTCKLITGGREFFIHVGVVVGAVSEPEISTVYSGGTTIELKCEANKWYPKPEIEWRFGAERVSSNDSYSTEHDGYYSVLSRITVEMMVNSIYTCTVRQKNIHQSRETNYTVLGIYGEREILKNSKSLLTGLSIVFGMIIFALVLWIFMYTCGKRFQCVKRTFGKGDESDRLNRDHLENEINNLQKQVSELQKEKEDLVMEIGHWKEEVEKFQKENRDLRQLVSCGHFTPDNDPENSPCRVQRL